MPDRLPASATTLAEAFLNAGFATFHTSSVQFTGKLTNLHQGVEVLHERASIDGDAFGVSNSKAARTYIDRFLEWVAVHHDVPFFAFIHVFDPHTPFEPYAPYDTMWARPTGKADHEARLKQVQDHFGENTRVGVRAHRGPESLPDTVELEQAGVDVDEFLDHEIDWYDGSIRAMGVEIGRLLEGLDQLGLSDKTLVAFISEHGEELLDHGKYFHGNSLYGEMLNVPLILWWPGVVPPSLVVEETTESISLMPTLLELSGLRQPDELQGQSLVPFMASPGSPSTFGWEPRPAFSERVSLPSKADRELDDLDGFSIVTDGWKLIQNLNPPEGFPEYELFDHENDTLNHENVAAAHPDVVERLAGQLAERQRWAEARRLPSDEDALEGLKRFSNRPCTTWGGRGTSAHTDAGGPMRAYSMDLRARALLDSDAGMKAADVAAKYRVSGSWVRRLKQRRRDTGEVAPRVQRHGRRCMREPHLHTVAALIAAHPDRTLG